MLLSFYLLVVSSISCLASTHDSRELNKLFIKAARKNCPSILKQAYEAGANPQIKDQSQYSPLFIAAYSHHYDCLKYLLTLAEVSVHDRGPFNETILMVTASKDSKIIDFLLTGKYKVKN